ncbi:MAG: phosphoribulokinase [Deltaproteobacteria bacterium]|nr:phosphoribulokinase [Deltaproteobacteria bacterium]MAY80546.1 phosphoribulokinase [Deltaproteobacteria bacterium]
MSAPQHTFQHALDKLGLPHDVIDSLDTIYRPVAQWISKLKADHRRPIIIGVNGAQGSGKSTFCALLTPLLCEAHNIRTVTLSIDDVYHTRDTRLKMARTVHPLCGIRGVPGTHDVQLAHSVLDQLSIADAPQPVSVPRFDKSTDDRRSPADWDIVTGPVDVVLFEGWCVGCPNIPEWKQPYNDREAAEDPHGVWVRWSGEQLQRNYQPLFDRMDALVMIEVPSMDTVRQGRWLQEQRLWDACGIDPSSVVHPPGLMSRTEVDQYVALFERYTEHMLATLPSQADTLIARRDGFSYDLHRIPPDR